MTDRNAPEFLPAVRRARIGRLNIYEVSDSELQLLERGSPESLYLNFAIFLLSAALSFLTALFTTEIPSARLQRIRHDHDHRTCPGPASAGAMAVA